MSERVSGAQAHEADDARAPAAAPDSDPASVYPRFQTYPVCIPADRIEELHRVAEQLGESPARVLRRWALERLDSDPTRRPPAGRLEHGGEPGGHGEPDDGCRGGDRRAGALRLGSTRRLIANRQAPLGPAPSRRVSHPSAAERPPRPPTITDP
jgi:hypothetical protein